MNFLILRSLILTFFISLTPLCFSQYRYDLGLKVSAFEREGLQLEQRFHLKSPYIVSATFSLGGRTGGYAFNGDLAGDTIHDQTNFVRSDRFYGVKLGLARKLSIMSNDFFYVGGSILGGYEEFRTDSSRFVTYYDPNGSSILLETGETVSNVNDQKRTFKSGVYFQLGLEFGMDIPISKRFSINCGLNGIMYQSSLGNSTPLGIRFALSASGGLRFAFGATDR